MAFQIKNNVAYRHCRVSPTVKVTLVKTTITTHIQKAMAEKRMSLNLGGDDATITVLAAMLVAFRWVVLMAAGPHSVPDTRQET
jgi:hypothetical protein